MRRKTLVLIPVALLFAGVTGMQFVHASGPTPPAQVAPSTSKTTVDGDNVQSGDQTASDVAGKDASDVADTGAAATDNVQSGDQNAPDVAGAGTTGESTAPETK